MDETKKLMEMKECTFQPSTYSQKQRRNFEQFLSDQQQFQENRQRKQIARKDLKEQEKENQYTKVP